jgi:hypothetical protein
MPSEPSIEPRAEVPVHGVRVRYVDTGTGDPLVLLR